MTKIGALRTWYAANILQAPSRFADEGRAYKAWAARADAYMAWRDGAPEVAGAVEVPRKPFEFANITTELVGWTRTKSCSLNAGSWEVAPGVTKWFVSLTADGREFKIFQLEDRAATLAWVAETCGEVAWEEC